MTDTIYALATAQGRAGIAVIRVSGPRAFESLSLLSSDVFPPRQAVLTRLFAPHDRSLIDECIVITYHQPRSYTGEKTVEYNIHGGKAVRDSLLLALSKMEGHRLAEPGEFTRRAFENGTLDLTQAEAVADLIHAETEMQKQLALRQMGGSLSDLYQSWAADLVKALAYAEAQIDFAEEDLPEDEVRAHITPVLEKTGTEIDVHLNDGHRGEILREGIKIAIIGAPNAGKSSLINALAKRDVAIVSDMAGTTRDVLEVHLDLNGYPVILYDTAGLRSDTDDAIEREGIRRVQSKAEESALRILLFDGTKPMDKETLSLRDNHSLVVVNKIDLIAGQHDSGMLGISTKTGAGLEELIETVSRETAALFEDLQTAPSLTRARHREALVMARDHITRALNAQTPDLIAEDIRLCVRAIGRITGRVDVEDLLDIIFRDFCIGK